MGKIFRGILIVLALVIFLVVYSGPIINTVKFYVYNPYSDFTETQLDLELAEVNENIARVETKIRDLKIRDAETGRMNTADSLSGTAQGLVKRREALIREKRMRDRHVHHALTLAFVVSTAVFLLTVRKIIIYRDPRYRKTQKAKRAFDKKLAKQGGLPNVYPGGEPPPEKPKGPAKRTLD